MTKESLNKAVNTVYVEIQDQRVSLIMEQQRLEAQSDNIFAKKNLIDINERLKATENIQGFLNNLNDRVKSFSQINVNEFFDQADLYNITTSSPLNSKVQEDQIALNYIVHLAEENNSKKIITTGELTLFLDNELIELNTKYNKIISDQQVLGEGEEDQLKLDFYLNQINLYRSLKYEHLITKENVERLNEVYRNTEKSTDFDIYFVKHTAIKAAINAYKSQYLDSTIERNNATKLTMPQITELLIRTNQILKDEYNQQLTMLKEELQETGYKDRSNPNVKENLAYLESAISIESFKVNIANHRIDGLTNNKEGISSSDPQSVYDELDYFYTNVYKGKKPEGLEDQSITYIDFIIDKHAKVAQERRNSEQYKEGFTFRFKDNEGNEELTILKVYPIGHQMAYNNEPGYLVDFGISSSGEDTISQSQLIDYHLMSKQQEEARKHLPLITTEELTIALIESRDKIYKTLEKLGSDGIDNDNAKIAQWAIDSINYRLEFAEEANNKHLAGDYQQFLLAHPKSANLQDYIYISTIEGATKNVADYNIQKPFLEEKERQLRSLSDDNFKPGLEFHIEGNKYELTEIYPTDHKNSKTNVVTYEWYNKEQGYRCGPLSTIKELYLQSEEFKNEKSESVKEDNNIKSSIMETNKEQKDKMPTITIRGYVGVDAKIDTTNPKEGEAKQVAKFSVGVKKGDQTEWHNVQIWGDKAKDLAAFKKGNYVDLTGYNKHGEFTAKQDGQNHKAGDTIKTVDFITTAVNKNQTKEERAAYQEQNTATMKGKLTADPIIENKEGKKVAYFTVCTKDKNEKANEPAEFQKCVVYGDAIDKANIGDLKKGQAVDVKGFLGEEYNFKKQDGSEGVGRDLIVAETHVMQISQEQSTEQSQGQGV